MEEKKNEIRSSIWSIFNSGHFPKFLFLPYSNSKNRGFTLVELLVVIAIMGILAGGLMMIIDPAGQLKRSRDGQRKADLKQIQAGLELYRSDVGSYPANLNGTSLTNADGSITYIQTIPKDPKSPTTDYLYAQTGSGYTLTACNETGESDKDNGVSEGSLTGCASGYIIQYKNP